MKGFRKLVMLGVVLVTLLLVIDTIDAGRKKEKKRELETEKSYNTKFTNKNKQTESTKQYNGRNNGNFGDENQYSDKFSRLAFKKTDENKSIKFSHKDKKYTDNENTKTSKHLKKSRKISALGREPVEKFNTGKSKGKKTKPHFVKSDNVFKTVKKTTQKKLIEENENIEKTSSEELNRLKNEDNISMEESVGGNPKKRKYKLVEVVLEEDGQEEEQEGNETTIELGLEDHEFGDIQSEETTTDKTSLNSKYYKNKKNPNHAEEDQNEDFITEEYYINFARETDEPEFNEATPSKPDSYPSRYDDSLYTCARLPEDPNRKGPKKLTLYVVEEEINGKIKKRVVHEEDGVTMCEVADLLKEMYGTGNPEE